MPCAKLIHPEVNRPWVERIYHPDKTAMLVCFSLADLSVYWTLLMLVNIQRRIFTIPACFIYTGHTHTWILADSERQPSILHSEILICFITAAHAKYFPFRTLLLSHLALLIQLFQSFCVTMSSSFVLVRPIDSKEKAVQFVKFFILSDYVSYMA